MSGVRGALCGVALLVGACAASGPDVVDSGALPGMTGLVLRDMPGGRVQWELRADSVREGAATTRLEGVRMLWQVPGRPGVQAEAPSGVWDAAQGRMDLLGPIRVALPGQDVAVSGHGLVWRRSTRVITMAGGLEVQRGRSILRAEAMEADEGLRRLRLRGTVRLSVPVALLSGKPGGA
ncbi:MAG: hypothetical protein VKP57_11705 [Candidatus Sericytochromatia bacterium]|nr:hypothetical protein [Candidatus Sericytochromatia bacterium]